MLKRIETMCMGSWESVLLTRDSTQYYTVLDRLNGVGIKHKSRIRRLQSTYEILVPAEISGLAYKAIRGGPPLHL